MSGEEWRNGNWCKDNFLNYRALQKVFEIKKQLRGFVGRMIGGAAIPTIGDAEGGADIVLRALVTGFVFNVARIMPDGKYRTVRGDNVVEVSPMSLYSEFGKHSEYIVFEHTEDNPRKFGLLQLVGVSAINGNWLRGDGAGGGAGAAGGLVFGY